MFVFEDLNIGVRIIVPRQSDGREVGLRLVDQLSGPFARQVINFYFVYRDDPSLPEVAEVEEAEKDAQGFINGEEVKVVFRPRMHLEVGMTGTDISNTHDLGYYDPYQHKGQIQWFTLLEHFYEKRLDLPFDPLKSDFPGRALVLIKHWGDPNVGWG